MRSIILASSSFAELFVLLQPQLPDFLSLVVSWVESSAVDCGIEFRGSDYWSVAMSVKYLLRVDTLTDFDQEGFFSFES